MAFDRLSQKNITWKILSVFVFTLCVQYFPWRSKRSNTKQLINRFSISLQVVSLSITFFSVGTYTFVFVLKHMQYRWRYLFRNYHSLRLFYWQLFYKNTGIWGNIAQTHIIFSAKFWQLKRRLISVIFFFTIFCWFTQLAVFLYVAACRFNNTVFRCNLCYLSSIK